MSIFLLIVCISIYLPPILMLILYEWIDAWRSGWMKLARLYRVAQEPGGRRFEGTIIHLNTRRYLGITTVVMNSRGLYISFIPRWFIFHPPVLVPWNRMHLLKNGSANQFELEASVPVILQLTEPALHEAIRQFEFNSPPEWRLMPQRKVG